MCRALGVSRAGYYAWRKRAPSAAEGLNLAIGRARHEWVVCVHQDVFLPAGWERMMVSQLREAERRFGPVGVAGVYGVGEVLERPGQPPAARRVGRVVDRGRMLDDGPDLPARVATLDELLLAVPRDSPARFEPAVGFHFYGADLCLTSARRGLASVVLDALCFHNSQFHKAGRDFYQSALAFANKWSEVLPVSTCCAEASRPSS